MHDHQFEHHQHHHSPKEGKAILYAFALNASFTLIEIVGAYLTNSTAILSDALHDFGDSLALLFSYFAEKYGQKDPDSRYTFGYGRFPVLSTVVNGVILITGSGFILYEAIQRLQSPEVVHPQGMLGLAILGVLVNSIAAYKLSKTSGMNSRMVMLHLIEDILGWIGVLVVSVVLLFKPWYQLDSILSVLIALIILKGVFRPLKKAIEIFLQKFPEEIDIEMIKKEILAINPVTNVHAIKGWAIDQNQYYLRFHVQVPPKTFVKDLDKVRAKIKTQLNLHKVPISTIEFESSAIAPDRCL